MKALKTIMKALSSKELLLWLAGAWMIYYVTMAMLTGEAFGRFMEALNTSWAARVPYLIFVLSSVLNVVRVFRDRWNTSRLGAIASVVLPVGLVIFLSGFFMSSVYRQWMWAQVGEGQTVRPQWEARAVQVGPISPALERKTLQAEEEGLIFAFEPKVKLSDGRSIYTVGAFPPTRIGGDYYHILNFGLAPGVRLEQDGRTLEAGYVMLQILPPGAQDSFELRPFPYVFSAKIAPEKIIQKGDTKMKLYDFEDLDYDVGIRRGDRTVFEGSTSEGRVDFEGLELTFSKPTYWVLLEIVKDPGRSVLLWGLAIVTLGLPLWLVSHLCKRRKAD